MPRKAQNLFDGIASFEALHAAALRAAKGKRGKPGVAAFLANLETEVLCLERELRNGSYRPGGYRKIEIFDPKHRIVSAAPFRDRVVHHAWCAVCEPLFERGFIYDSYANRVLDNYGEEAVNRYWKEVYPYVRDHNDDEILEMLDRLLDVKRPREAFHAVKYDWSRIETTRLKRLLRDAATVDNEPEEHYQISPHHLSKALSVLGGRSTGVSEEEMAHFEFQYIGILDLGDYRMKNLERQVFKAPLLFVQILALVFRRDDGAHDPADWHVEDSQRQRLGGAAYRILDRIALNPERKPDGSVDVDKMHDWVSKTRELCSQYGRSDIGDQCIGQLLARMDVRDGTGRPGTCVCDVMERVASKEIGVGYLVAVSNSRGAYIRDAGGTQERDLALKYRDWGNELKFTYPYMARVLEDLAAMYDGQARWYDDSDALHDRLMS